MNMFGSTLLIVCVAIPVALAKCNHEIKNLEIKPCDGTETIFNIVNPNVKFNDKCDLVISGTGKVLKTVNKLLVEYKASKNNMPILTGTKDACNENLWGTNLTCPMEKGKVIKSTPKWIYELPKGALALASGKITGSGTVITDIGEACYKGSATVK